MIVRSLRHTMNSDGDLHNDSSNKLAKKNDFDSNGSGLQAKLPAQAPEASLDVGIDDGFSLKPAHLPGQLDDVHRLALQDSDHVLRRKNDKKGERDK